MAPYSIDNEIIDKFSDGDKSAFTALYHEFYYKVYQYAKKWLPDYGDAEDLTADTFVKLWDRRKQFESLDAIGAFLHVTVRNACFDVLRHRKVRDQKQADLLEKFSRDTEEDFALQDIREELLKMVYAEVDKMPARMKTIFLLSYAEGLKPAEIAERLGLNVQTVRNQKANALSLLRLVMGDKTLIAFLILLEFEKSWRS